MKKSALTAYFSKLGKKGGKARADKLSPKRRQEIARLAGSCKGKQKKAQAASMSHLVRVGQ